MASVELTYDMGLSMASVEVGFDESLENCFHQCRIEKNDKEDCCYRERIIEHSSFFY